MTAQTMGRGPVGPEHYVADDPRQRHITYIAVGAALLAVLIVGLFTSRAQAETTEALAKAQTLTSEFNAAGIPAPRKDQIVRTLGVDGGAVCSHPDSALKVAVGRASMYNGATGPGARPVLAARSLVNAERLVIQTYCPDKLAEYEDFLNSHQYADVIKS